MVFVNNIYLCQ